MCSRMTDLNTSMLLLSADRAEVKEAQLSSSRRVGHRAVKSPRDGMLLSSACKGTD